MLIAIKLLHTLIWAVLATSILALPVLAQLRRFRRAAILSVVVWIECLVILVNAGRCPLTTWAARFTSNRAPNFDIYLPVWLARYNQLIFGALFAVGEFAVIWAWTQQHRSTSREEPAEETGSLQRTTSD